MSGFIIYILVSIFTPGPNNIFASVSSMRIGIRKSQRFMLGVFLGTFLVFCITGIFNVILYENVRIVTQIIGVVGGLFIIYLAFRMFLTRHEESEPMIKSERIFVTAVFLNFVNAKGVIFGLTVATYYLQLEFNPDWIIPFAFLMALLCYVSVLAWGLFGRVFRQLLTKYSTIFNIVMALLLAYSGVLIIIESI